MDKEAEAAGRDWCICTLESLEMMGAEQEVVVEESSIAVMVFLFGEFVMIHW